MKHLLAADEMERTGKTYEEVMADREAAAEAERDRRRDDELIEQLENDTCKN